MKEIDDMTPEEYHLYVRDLGVCMGAIPQPTSQAVLGTYRAPGDMKCEMCGYKYIEHPQVDEALYPGAGGDHVICNGDVVHL